MTTPDRRSESEQGITRISVEGYKSLRTRHEVEIRPLTVLAGVNSSGKSSVMQPLLLLKQTLDTSYDPGPLLLSGPNVDVTAIEQVLSRTAPRNGHAPSSGLSVGVVVDDRETSWRFGKDEQGNLRILAMAGWFFIDQALDVERRKAWNELRRSGNAAAAKKFKGARWALLKRPDNLTDEQAATLRKLKRRGGDVWRAYTLKEAFRAIFAGDLNTDQVAEQIDRWISRASRSRLPAFVKAAKTIRKFRDGLLAAIRLNINNGRAEGLNNVVRLIFRRARAFHSPEAALALVMLTCGPITLHLPHERPKIRPG